MFISHRGDERVIQPCLFNNPHLQALGETDSGRALAFLLDYCKLTMDDVYLTNVLKCLLPQDIEPEEQAYRACISHLEREIQQLNPRAIVIFGREAFDSIFEYMGQRLHYHGQSPMPRLNFNARLLRAEIRLDNIPTLVMNHYCRIHRIKKDQEAQVLKDFLVRAGVI
jgi:uracil-DNA glycosylase family 4